jgi:integrase
MTAYMARINFTAPRITAYQCEEGKDQSFLWDTISPCLALRATASGSKAYIFQSRLHGKNLRITLGSPPAWKIQDAREEANRLKVMVDKGTDPREVAAETKAKSTATALEKSSRKLLAREAWDAYMNAPHPKWGEAHRIEHLTSSQEGGAVPKIGKGLTRPAPLASLLALPLHEITSDAVEAWLRKEILTRPSFAQNCLRKFRTFIVWCSMNPAYKSAVHADCCTAKVVRDITPPNKTKPNDCLQKEQLKLWFAHIRQIGNPVFSAFYQALLLTGARRGEMQILKWTDVDFQWNQMTIRDKVKGLRTIPLTPHLASLFQSLPRINDYVFSSTSSKEGFIIGMTKPHMTAVKNAGLPHISIHGLRRSFATLSEWLEIPAGVVKQIIGHSPGSVAERHYIQRSIDLLRMHHTKIEAFILEQA